MLRETITADAVCADFWTIDGEGTEGSEVSPCNPESSLVANTAGSASGSADSAFLEVRVVSDPFSEPTIPLLEQCPEAMPPARRAALIEYLLDSIL